MAWRLLAWAWLALACLLLPRVGCHPWALSTLRTSTGCSPRTDVAVACSTLAVTLTTATTTVVDAWEREHVVVFPWEPEHTATDALASCLASLPRLSAICLALLASSLPLPPVVDPPLMYEVAVVTNLHAKMMGV
jgi:tellurite resistance protein TehA-like permease